MEKITSFTIDHIKLQPGVYVSRKDPVGDQVITTFDIRMTSPNEEPVMNTAELHAMEHLAATFLRNHKEFGPKELVVTTYQAISGAGKTFKDWPEMVENIIPFIGGEEEKSEQEPLRVLGKVENGQIVKAELPKITCQCVRVPVLNGHTAAVFINFEKKPTKEQLIEKLVAFKGFPQEAELPSAPKQFIQYLEEDNRPQVTEDVNYERGMGVSIGRLREDTMFDYKFIGLSHNTVRGAAGGAVLCAEALTAKGYIAAK